MPREDWKPQHKPYKGKVRFPPASARTSALVFEEEIISMQLSRPQLAVLQTYQRWKRSPPGYWSLMKNNDWRRFFVMGIAAAVCSYVLSVLHAPLGGLVLLGMFLGELRAESGRLANTAWVWPVFSRLIDWDRLERAIADKRID
jgi:hypothetical protein